MKLLTKSRFKQALECPNKLYFAANPQYVNSKKDDSFLQSLAEGGFQVEALARLHYPNGVFIDTEPYEYDKAVRLTNEALQREHVAIFEAAFQYDGCFVRTDLLVKTGNKIRVIEVKAKSYDPLDENTFIGKKGGIDGKMKPYLFDLAFQKYVATSAHPEFEYEAWFMLADKSKRAGINGLNQKFRIPKGGNPRTEIRRLIGSLEEAGGSVLSEVCVDDIINDIISGKHKYYPNLTFEEAVSLFRDAFCGNKYLSWDTNITSCKKCEFQADDAAKASGSLSGFEHCFTNINRWKPEDFNRPNLMEVWYFSRGNEMLAEGRFFLDQILEDDFKIKAVAGKMSRSERQYLQACKSRDKDMTPEVLTDELREEMNTWKFPLHFIDFETSTVALPFNTDRRPYEQTAFQFSHHQYNEDGSVEHKTEFISNTAGEFPNFVFARALRDALSKDSGTIFKFANHENAIVNAIIVQLRESTEHDRDELITFLKSISHSGGKSADDWCGDRDMVDLNKVVINYYYNPLTRGSNSIKAVLPAALQSSDYLRNKYSKPLKDIHVTSRNFAADFVWMPSETDVNPYKLLPPLFKDWSVDEVDELLSGLNEDGIANGGAALTAYAKLQYEDMSEAERDEITKGLLKYCELDTLAMVMIYEHFRFDLIS